MAKFFFCVYESAGEVAYGDPQQYGVINVGATHTQGAVIANTVAGVANRRRRVRLFADVDCFVAWGLNPEALADGTNGMPVGAENPEFADIETGHRISVIERV